MEAIKKEIAPIEVISTNQQSSSKTQRLSSTNSAEEVDTRSLTEMLMAFAPQQRRSGFCLRLYLPTMLEPVEVWNQNIITIGRRDVLKGKLPDIDLSNHYGARLGVSRLHAQISYQDARFWLIDLESKNKTWLNGELMKIGEKYLISHGDSLRLGHLMIQVGACQYEKVILEP